LQTLSRRKPRGLDFSPHTLALEAIVERLDVLIDQVLEDGVQDDAPPGRPGVGRWTLPPRPAPPQEDTP